MSGERNILKFDNPIFKSEIALHSMLHDNNITI